MNNMGTLETKMHGTVAMITAARSLARSAARPPRGWVGAWLGALALLGLALGACKVSEGDLKQWAAAKDSGRLARVVSDSKQKTSIRVKAALLLVDIRRLVDLEKGLKRASEGDRKKIAAAIIKELGPKVAAKDADPAERALAKDGIFSAWYFAEAKDRRRVEELIVDWFLDGKHGEAHEHSIAKMFDAFGRRGADLLAQRTPYYDPNFFRYSSRDVVSPSCLLGHFWKRVSPQVRTATVRRYMAAARKNTKAALINNGALLCGIGLLGKRVGSRFLANILATNKNIMMKAGAVVALRMAALADPANLDPDVQTSLIGEVSRLMTKVNAGKGLDNPVFRGTGYLFHLLELVAKFKGDAIFKGLAPVVGAPSPKLADQSAEDKRTQLRLLVVGFLMRVDPRRALELAYSRLPTTESYPLGYLNGTILDNAVYVWSKLKPLRKRLLEGLRLGLSSPSWVGKIIGVEGLSMKELLPRAGVAADLAAIRKLTGDTTPLKGIDWKDATLGKRAKKAVELLSKKK